MAKRRTKRTVKKPPPTVDNSNDSEEQQVEEKLLALSAHEVERRVTAIQAICDSENENLLTRLRLLRSCFSNDQLNIPALQFFKENLPNLSVIFNDDGEYELEWNAKSSNVPANDDAERNMHSSLPPRTSIAYPSNCVAAVPNISVCEFSSKAVKTSFLEAASLHIPDFVSEEPSETLKLGFLDALQTPGATSQRLSVGMTPKTLRLPKHGEMLLSVHGSPLGVYKEEDNMEVIHESEEG